MGAGCSRMGLAVGKATPASEPDGPLSNEGSGTSVTGSRLAGSGIPPDALFLGGFSLSVAELLQDDKLTIGDLRTYLAISSLPCQDGRRNASLKEISERANVSRATIQRGVTRLKANGQVLVKRTGRGSEYILHSKDDTSDISSVQHQTTQDTATPEESSMQHQPGTDVAPSDPTPSLFPDPKVPTVKKSKRSKTKSDPLFSPIMDAFLSQYPDRKPSWDYAAQGKGVNRIVKRCREQPNPEEFAQGVMEAYLSLTKGNDKFWQSQPFTPMNLNSEGIWTRVVKSMEEEPGLDIEAIVREATCRSTK